MACELSVVLPTYNEAANIPLLVERITRALGPVRHEIVVADDDSPDRTWEIAQALAARYPSVRALRRTRDRGLYPAVLDGFELCSGEFLAVMDADLQHDETILPKMLESARREGLSLVIGSRYSAGGGIEDWNLLRRLISRACTAFLGAFLSAKTSDPLSGFFLLERGVYREIRSSLHPRGFKILFDILMNLPAQARVGEVGFVFQPRRQGASKLGPRVVWQFLLSVLESKWARLRRCRPTRP